MTMLRAGPDGVEVEIRASAPEPAAFATLFATTGWDPEGRLDAAAARAALRHSWFDVTAWAAGRLVGMGRIVGDGVLHALLVDIVVDPAYQGHGIGSRIVERLVDECRRHRIADVQLFAARGKRSFYETLGFTGRSGDAPGMELADQLADPPDDPAVTGRRLTRDVPVGGRRDLPSAELARRDDLADRISQAAVGTFDLVHVYLGERLGLFRALADDGPATAPALAARTGLHQRYVREWLEQGAVAGILAVEQPDAEPSAWRYALPPGHAAALLDRDSLRYATPTALSLLGALRALPLVADLFRSGGGLTLDAVGEDLREGEATGNRPQYLSLLGGAWLSAVPGLDTRLRSDPPARVLDVGMGLGWSSIALALAYPKVTVDGLDLDEPSVLAARRNALETGVADRVRFESRSAADPGPSGPYDLVTAFECIHDMSDPVGALAAIRASLAVDGVVLVADEKADETFAAPGDDLQRYLYGWSVLHCLPAGMDGPDAAGTGGVMRPETLRRYALEAGFGSMEVLPVDHRSWRFYLLRP